MNRTVTATLLIGSALAMAGCASPFGKTERYARATTADLEQADFSSYFAQRLNDGKLHLRAGQLTHAITAFRQAAVDARYKGEALNGMAIAYDKLGRDDLSRRYFGEAIAAAPEDMRFQRNFARFEGRAMRRAQLRDERVELAAREATKVDEMVPEVAAALDQLRPDAAVRIAPTRSRIERVSRGEVQIRSSTSSSNDRPAVAVPRRAVVERPDVVHVASRKGEGQYPLVFNVTREMDKPNQRNYPLRISMNAKNGD